MLKPTGSTVEILGMTLFHAVIDDHVVNAYPFLNLQGEAKLLA